MFCFAGCFDCVCYCAKCCVDCYLGMCFDDFGWWFVSLLCLLVFCGSICVYVFLLFVVGWLLFATLV